MIVISGVKFFTEEEQTDHIVGGNFCPKCGDVKTCVSNCRMAKVLKTMTRTRKCLVCGHKWETIEIISPYSSNYFGVTESIKINSADIKKEVNKIRLRNRADTLRAKGCCVKCGKPNSDMSKTLCPDCRSEQREKYKRRVAMGWK